jgi:hypothetical protein
MKDWPLTHDGFEAIAPGFEHAFRRGVAALALAESAPTAAAFHDFRKRVKDHLYHVRLLQDVWPGVLDAYQHVLKDLETSLGDDHNLDVLGQTLAAESPQEGRALSPAIEKRQAELRDRALKEGRSIYGVKPKYLKKSMNALWDLWHNGNSPGKTRHDR